MIKVGIDTSVFNGPSKFRGIGMYTSRLVSALKLIKDVEVREITTKSELIDLDLIHYPVFDFFFLTLPIIKKKKSVVTVHDCIPLVFPEQYPTGIKGKIKFGIQKYSLKNVDAVLTDSENSKKDIVRFLNVPEDKIQVVYLAADPVFKKISSNSTQLKTVSKKYELPSKFVLYVGDVNYNKNLFRLIEAFSKMNDESNHLVLIGKAFENKSLKETISIVKFIENLKISDRVHLLGFVTDEDLLAIYNLAQIYCMPSLYEGFGLQILEAMSCGCPVITSNLSSMTEISGNAALLVNPLSVDEITSSLNVLSADKTKREDLINKGLIQSKKFSWENAATETFEVYKRVFEK